VLIKMRDTRTQNSNPIAVLLTHEVVERRSGTKRRLDGRVVIKTALSLFSDSLSSNTQKSSYFYIFFSSTEEHPAFFVHALLKVFNQNDPLCMALTSLHFV
ncbi:hypothetical protein L9F63_005434, partial [Diploptera punctata]